mmetsp:Transcript_22521/g.49759  ORF Transcript_22521/g.49759 Transcript_22521/m.49759 type:complete len:394 (-) Transcript_22521:152-1333(-)|eukprot:CAMPEP_0170598940 /NCGR_PEP_ID=MMETSP0224-20130122/16521_1 /TAXON_ID=285029 /ORGANISM="Togula jolla, Strain CCCM 725" /LENGTH=393 /DNA_ID=CAMNT_0010923537 /DNA_START=88 /DNA_END=1269 /DNA_ORIENTATION=-
MATPVKSMKSIPAKLMPGKKQDAELLALHESLRKGADQDGKVTKVGIDKLWEASNKGSPNELQRATLEYFLGGAGHLSGKAKSYLTALLKGGTRASIFTTMFGAQYDKGLLEKGAEIHKRRGRLNFRDAKGLYELAEDGPSITETERRTLAHIYDTYDLDPLAEIFAMRVHLGKEARQALKPKAQAADTKPKEPSVYEQAKSIGTGSLEKGLKPKQAEDLWTLYDQDKSGQLDHAEVVSFVADVVKAKMELTGSSDQNEFEALRSMLQNHDSIDAISKKLNLNKDGAIAKSEFMALCGKGFAVIPKVEESEFACYACGFLYTSDAHYCRKCGAPRHADEPPKKKMRLEFERRIKMARKLGYEDVRVTKLSIEELAARIDKELGSLRGADFASY